MPATGRFCFERMHVTLREKNLAAVCPCTPFVSILCMSLETDEKNELKWQHPLLASLFGRILYLWPGTKNETERGTRWWNANTAIRRGHTHTHMQPKVVVEYDVMLVVLAWTMDRCTRKIHIYIVFILRVPTYEHEHWTHIKRVSFTWPLTRCPGHVGEPLNQNYID